MKSALGWLTFQYMPDLPIPSVRRDPVFAVALAVLLLGAAAALVPVGVGGAPLSPLLARTLSVLAALIAVVFRPAAEPRRTRIFWRLIAAGLSFYFVAQLYQAAVFGALLPALMRRQELLYLGRYLFLVMALETRPDVPHAARSDEELRLLDTLGAVLFLFAVVSYVLLSPSTGAPSVSALPMRVLYILLDVFLVVRAFTLRQQSGSVYWRRLYLCLGVLFALRGLNNLIVEPAQGGAMATVGADPATGPLWFVLFVPLIVSARFTVGSDDAVPTSPVPSALRGRLAPLVAYAFALPIFHFSMERLGIVDDEIAGPRETVVLLFLGVAAILLWIYQRVLIRENQRLEAERELMAEQAAEGRRMEGLGRLAGGVAHDFNNLLTVIRGRTELLLAERGADLLLKEDLEAIRQATRRGEGVTRQLLAFGRRQILRPEVLDLGGVVNEMAPLLRSAVSDEVRITVQLGDAAPFVVADQGQVEMALLNLAVNAREAMPGGGLIAISVERVELDAAAAAEIPEARAGAYVMLVVKDTGRGMDAATLERIFDPFFTTKPFGSGAGLGLPAVHGFVRQSGGAIAVESEPGRGATFRIYLPRVDGAAVARAGAD